MNDPLSLNYLLLLGAPFLLGLLFGAYATAVRFSDMALQDAEYRRVAESLRNSLENVLSLVDGDWSSPEPAEVINARYALKYAAVVMDEEVTL